MKAAELKEKSEAELNTMLEELHREQFNLQMQKGTGQLSKPHLIKQGRREIARVLTILNQKK